MIHLPSVNAALNFTTTILLVLGYILIRRRAIPAHKVCMIAASITSTLFLACYLFYHFYHGRTSFPGTGFARPIYFTILISHTILAVVQLPLIFMTLFRAFRGQFEKHRAIARVTLPIWLYVSVTGVVIYWLLYQVSW